MYDVTNEASYRNIESWRQAFLKSGNEESIPFVIIGNKTDLDSNVSES